MESDIGSMVAAENVVWFSNVGDFIVVEDNDIFENRSSESMVTINALWRLELVEPTFIFMFLKM